MNLGSFTGPGSTPSRRRFWDKVTAYVTASQKVAGRNVTIAEHHAAGTLINVVGGRGRASGACCVDDVCSIQTAADCAAGGGTYQGDGTVCDPNPCGAGNTGACCILGECSIHTESDCIAAAGYYFGDGTDCDPDPCPDIGCCLTEGDPFTRCDTILPADCSGTSFSGTFCWPEGEQIFALNSCCLDGQIACPGGELGFHFCCNSDQTCCGDIGCCNEGETCDEIFGCM